MHNQQHFLQQIASDGFVLVPQLADEKQIEDLVSALVAAHHEIGARRNSSGVYAMRNLLQIEAVRNWARSENLRPFLAPVLGDNYFATRGILFDKTPNANWKVGWHQDLSIAVKNRVAIENFGPWSEKAGIIHVQPPREILENMLTLRLNLDDCGAENGPLRVLPASHLRGKMTPEEINNFRRQTAPLLCTASRGGALFMRPLLLHASSSATSPHHRRVVHIEFASQNLPNGLQWN